MFRRCLPAVIVLAYSSAVWAQSGPDAYLPANSQVYLSWDGVEPHRDAFRKSAVGKTLQGDTGKFLAALVAFSEEQFKHYENEIGADAGESFKEALRIFDIVGANGFRLAASVDGILPPRAEAMLVFPKAAGDEGKGAKGLLPLIAKLVDKSGVQPTESKIEGRTVFSLKFAPIEIGWWSEKGDLIVTVNTIGVQAAVGRVVGNGPNLLDYPLYKRTASFDGFPVWSRGYVDLEGMLKQVANIAPPARQAIDDLGLKNLKSITFQSGFDGPAERSVIEIDAPGPRKGILRLANQKKMKLSDLPPVPVDATAISASSLDVSQAYDVMMESFETIVKSIAPNEVEQLKNALQIAEAILGVALREDLVAPFGDMIMTYNSPSEIPLGLGAVYLVKVKDAETMNKTLTRLMNLAGGAPGVDIKTKTNKYHGADIHSVAINAEGNFQAPAFTVYKGWLAFSPYPQPVQGFVLRMNGELPSWKPNKNLEKTLSNMPTEFTALTVSDPRPTIKLLLSLAPVGVAALNGFLSERAPQARFDVGLIPNAHEATRFLFPNVMMVTDDGTKIRIETRASIMLPF